MPLPIVGATPQNQLDALPLLTAAQAANPGQVQIIGNTLTRYWDAVATGINAVNFVADANGFLLIKGNFLDVRGCGAFLVIMRRTSSDGSQLLASNGIINLGLQYRFDPTATDPPLSKGAAQNLTGACGAVLFNAGNVTWPAMQANFEFQDIVMSSSHAKETGLGASGAALFGSDVRLFFTASAAQAAQSRIAVTMWGFQT